jgi:chlorophyll synthase
LTLDSVVITDLQMSELVLPGSARSTPHRFPAVSAVVELLKPITWFPPMWAFMCGVVSSGAPLSRTWPLAVAGVLLAGPAICATSQAVNDWFDREVDAINEPGRPIPSGRIPGRWGLYIAILWTALSLTLAFALGPWVFGAGLLGMVLAWAYSAPPLRLKQNGWWGPASVAICYEGLAWFTGTAVMNQTFPDLRVVTLAALYSAGCVGIMVLNDFKAIEGDRQMGIRSVPVELGAENAAWLACVIMATPQIVVVALLFAWGRAPNAMAVGVSLLAQCLLMTHLLRDPRRLAPWYNGTGILLYVLGMLVSGFAVGTLHGVGG